MILIKFNNNKYNKLFAIKMFRAYLNEFYFLTIFKINIYKLMNLIIFM